MPGSMAASCSVESACMSRIDDKGVSGGSPPTKNLLLMSINRPLGVQNYNTWQFMYKCTPSVF